jgi:nicotinamidase-related amidase
VLDHPHGDLHDGVLEALRAADAVFIAGEAQSHCVLETLEDIVDIFGDEAASLEKFYLLVDCTSSVLHPQIDFEALSLEAFERFARRGLQFVRSTDPLPILEQAAAASAGPGESEPVTALHRMEDWE